MRKWTLHYCMNGRVRLLLFWVGRENVGRGEITIQDTQTAVTGSREEKITVLFGTMPERVPWRINRWGYGEEIEQWNLPGSVLDEAESSKFVGFMRHSPEESISQVASANGPGKDRKQNWYDGIISTADVAEARTEVYFFPLYEEVSIGELSKVQEAFKTRCMTAPPDKNQSLVNQPIRYGTPQGFLICLQRMISAISERCADRETAGAKQSLQMGYVYNAKPYQLKVLDVKLHSGFRLSAATVRNDHPIIPNPCPNVAEASLQILNLNSGDKDNFTIWFSVEGAFRNIPIQIQYNPRWWLQVQLQLTEIQETKAPEDTK